MKHNLQIFTLVALVAMIAVAVLSIPVAAYPVVPTPYDGTPHPRNTPTPLDISISCIPEINCLKTPGVNPTTVVTPRIPPSATLIHGWTATPISNPISCIPELNCYGTPQPNPTIIIPTPRPEMPRPTAVPTPICFPGIPYCMAVANPQVK